MYRRFVFARVDRIPRCRGGWRTLRIASICAWLDRHLPRPPRSAFREGRGFSWFKPEAGFCIDRVVELTRILQRRGERIWPLETRHPGLITYEDEFQVVAIPASEFEAVAPEAPSLPGGPGGTWPC